MKRLLIFLTLTLSLNIAMAASPFGVFDFDLRGATPAEKIHSIDDCAFDGIAMWMNSPKELEKFNAYQSAKPSTRLLAALLHLHADKPADFNRDHLAKVAKKLATEHGKFWLIISGDPNNEAQILTLIRNLADIAAAENVTLSLYPHDGHVMATAEQALGYLTKAARPNVTLSVHQCHELRAGNIDRLDAVVAAALPHLDMVTFCGSDRKTTPGAKDWSDAIKPLGEGDYDPKEFLRILKKYRYQGPIILHTFGLSNKPATHHKSSSNLYQKMAAEVAAEP
jgi:sugar phosphate isomerase/epimerase